MYLPTNHPVHAYKFLIRTTFSIEYPDHKPTVGPLVVLLHFMFPRSNNAERKAPANKRLAHVKKPDCDNLAKSTLDALNGLAFGDDKQVVTLDVTKRTCDGLKDRPGVGIHMERSDVHWAR